MKYIKDYFENAGQLLDVKINIIVSEIKPAFIHGSVYTYWHSLSNVNLNVENLGYAYYKVFEVHLIICLHLVYYAGRYNYIHNYFN